MKQIHERMRRRGGLAQPAGSSGTARCAAKPLPHPYDSAAGTIALGLALTLILALLIRQLAG